MAQTPIRLFSTTKGIRYTNGDTEVPTYHLTIADDLLIFKVTVDYVLNDETSTVTICDWKLPWSTIASTPRVKTNTLVGIIPPPRTFTKEFLTTAQVIILSEETRAQRIPFSTSNKLGPIPVELQIFIRDPSLGFTHQDIILSGEPNVVIDCAETFEYYKEEGVNNTAPHILLVDTITASRDTTYVNDDYVKYTVSSEPYVDEIYVEPINGIFDKTRITLTAGSGSLRVLKSSIETGTNVRVRFGFSSYIGLTEINEPL